MGGLRGEHGLGQGPPVYILDTMCADQLGIKSRVWLTRDQHHLSEICASLGQQRSSQHTDSVMAGGEEATEFS